MGVMAVTYNSEFYDQINDGSKRSAFLILDYVFNIVMPEPPDVVIDIGCGEGAWLWVAHSLGVRDTVGLDGDYVDRSRLMININNFHPTDLSTHTYSADDGKADLAISLEVAEHLPEESADGFVQMLTNYSDMILFSAAIPGQKGVGHINEQWPSYWIKKFNSHGFIESNCVREEFWNDERIDNWYRQNTIFFSRGIIEGVTSGGVLDCVHPNNWWDHHLSKI